MLKKLRAQKIEIDLPAEESEAWLNTTLQNIIKDGDYNTVQRIDRVGFTHRSLSSVATEMHTLVDPVTQQEYSISGAGVAQAIKTFVVAWMQQDHGGTVNEHGDLITEN